MGLMRGPLTICHTGPMLNHIPTITSITSVRINNSHCRRGVPNRLTIIIIQAGLPKLQLLKSLGSNLQHLPPGEPGVKQCVQTAIHEPTHRPDSQAHGNNTPNHTSQLFGWHYIASTGRPSAACMLQRSVCPLGLQFGPGIGQ